MEGIAYAKNGISGAETSNEPIVLIPPKDNFIRSDSQILSDHLTNNDSTNGILTNEDYQNGISPVYEKASYDNLLNDYPSTLVKNEVNSVSKVVPPTIFENAVKVVKNLFSPAKSHGIFARGTQNALMDVNDMKKTPKEGSHPVCKSFTSRLDEVLPTEDTERVLPVTILENIVNQNEEDFSNMTMKNTSNSISTHDITNDSYTTTVSIMDESFQSTITHFDENMQNEIEKTTEPMITVENYLDGTLNDTMKSNENSLDNTLMKNVSICSTVNVDLNGTFEIGAITKVENEVFKELSLDKETESAVKESSGHILLGAENTEKDQEIKGFVSVAEGNFLSFQEEDMLKSGTFSSTPSKGILSDKLSLSEKSFSNSLCEKGQECNQINGDNVDPLMCAEKNADSTKLGQPFVVNQSSENELSFFCIRNKSGFPEKSSTPKSADLEKNFSTSTIILTKNASETLDISSVKEEEKEVNNMTFDNVQKIEAEIQNDMNSLKSEISENRCQEMSSNILEKNILSPGLENDVITGDTKMEDGLDMEPKVDQIHKTASKSNSSEDICNSCSKSDVNVHALSFSSNSETNRLKPEGYSTDETQIPLASQKSYTVLHNPNPDLNRPIVLDYMCDVQAEKLNDIILGNCAFSDLPQFNNYSEELISDVAQTASQLYDSRGLITPNNGKLEKIDSKNMKFESSNPKKETVDLKISEISIEVGNLINGKQKFDVCEVFPLSKKPMIDSTESVADDVKFFDHVDNPTAGNIQSQSRATAEAEALENKNDLAVHQDPVLAVENSSKPDQGEVKEEETSLTISTVMSTLADRFENISITENNTLAIQFCGDGSLPSKENVEPLTKDEYQIFREDSIILNSSTAGVEMTALQTQIEKVATDLERLAMNNNIKREDTRENCVRNSDTFPVLSGPLVSSEQSTSCENSRNAIKESISGSEVELTQFIQEQFSAFDIEKICSVVDDVPELNLSKNIVLASQQFDKSFQEKTILESDRSKANNFVIGDDKSLSSALDFLDSIKGKPTGRDFSRESLYIKFDPLVQSKHSTGLSNISEGDKENLIISPGPKLSGSTEPLIPITPLKQTVNVSSPLSPLAPVTQKNEPKLSNEKLNKIRELQCEITRSRELFLQMEEVNKEKLNNYEREITKLTGRACVLEDKLKESEEMEKTLIKKLNVQNESINRLKNIMEEYLSYIGRLTDQMEIERMESHKKMKILTEERDYYMNHLQNTEQAFSDVHSKYEKCKKAVEIYKKNEETYKTSIEDLQERTEQYKEKIKNIQENAGKEMSRLQEKMNDMKANHTQEISRFKAQLRKTELKVQTIQEALDRKVKENQGLARICDELIDGKKRNC